MATTTQAAALPVHKPSLRERLDMGSGTLPYFLVAPTIIIIALVAVYPDLSNIIQVHVHQALTKAATPTDALSAMQTQLQALVTK